MSFDSIPLRRSNQRPPSKQAGMTNARDNIPSPPGLPLLGNILDVQNEVPIYGLERLIDIHGPIFKLNILGNERIFIGSAELVEELCDEKRFWKTPGDGLAALNRKKDAAVGLFTAPSEEDHDWQQAHRTLMPAFGPLSIQGMFGEMHDVASQLVLKWARMGPSYRIPVTSDFTRLTLDTIALCAMDYRFNSFYQDELHPFVQAMNSGLTAASDRLKVSSLVRKMMPWDKSAEKVKQDGAYMQQVARELVQIRRENPTEKRDLLNAMVNNADPKTGEYMSDELISANMVTFLIAGHETTSGLLSFAMVNLLKNPAAYFKAQQEVDTVLGRGKMTPEHLKDLRYIDAVLRETLRLTPTAPAFSRSIRSNNTKETEELLGGKYAIRRDDKVLCLIGKAQRDPKVYGDNANEFKPERMLEDNFQRLPKGAWKPFGNGVRACIGRAFAWQEAQMCLALILQSFNFTLDDPSYELKVKQTLTIKPDGFYMRATLRDGITATSLQNLLTSSSEDVHASVEEGIRRTDSGLGTGKPITILYGSNTGTCQALAQKLSVEARRHGYSADVKEMNAAVDVLPKDHPMVALTPSYEGQPADNADQFVAWLETMTRSSNLEGVEYAVFGCGHSDWANTFHRIPKLVDELLEKHGAKRIAALGLTDAAKGDIYSDFDNWADTVLWQAIAPDSSGELETSVSLEVEMSTQNRSSFLRQDVQVGTVTESRRLTADEEPEKRHLEVQLPGGTTYETGDYLAILPLNPQENVTRAMKHFKIAQDATITIKPGSATFLPTGVSLSVTDLLQGFMELNTPVSKKDLQACLEVTKDPVEKATLDSFTEKGFTEMIQQRVSLLDLCCKYKSIELAFSKFISMLPPLRPRHYSISSSPLHDPARCTVTYGVLDETARSGVGRYQGVTSTYLSTLKPGDEILLSVRATNKFFRLPADSETPIICIGAGSGIAPFRGFVQERAVQMQAGRKVGPILMFMGCRSETTDRLYADEIDAWVKMGALDIRYAFSRDIKKSNGCKYVQDRVLKDKEALLRLWRGGAKLFICGSPEVSSCVGEAGKQILLESQQERGETMNEEQANDWFRTRRNERFVVDVFA